MPNTRLPLAASTRLAALTRSRRLKPPRATMITPSTSDRRSSTRVSATGSSGGESTITTSAEARISARISPMRPTLSRSAAFGGIVPLGSTARFGSPSMLTRNSSSSPSDTSVSDRPGR